MKYLLYLAVLLAFAKPPAAHAPPKALVIKLPTPTPTPVPTATPKFQFVGVTIRPEWGPRLDVVIAGMVRDKGRYVGVQNMRPNGMPWYFVGGIHERESSRSFKCHLHEGSPLIHRTQYVPKGRPLHPEPPYTWEQSSEDALYVLKHENQVHWYNTPAALDAIEAYNGLGYRRYHSEVKTPYLWSGTSFYSRGKYVADGRFSPTAIDRQAGVAALWLRMKERGLTP